ncbi:hypothetical protein GCM10009804_16500 [Kribbella hippodromi]|uniref:Transmembrane protein n=1 Tax=Kribbella hippodromi TaxID=434347 RepID=A0ABN2CKX6_9ACTN
MAGAVVDGWWVVGRCAWRVWVRVAGVGARGGCGCVVWVVGAVVWVVGAVVWVVGAVVGREVAVDSVGGRLCVELSQFLTG